MPSAIDTMVALMRTADLARRTITGVIEPHGLTPQQFNVLRILRGAGAEGLPTLEVANRMIEQTPGITRLLDGLEAKELIKRQRCPKDRRQHLRGEIQAVRSTQIFPAAPAPNSIASPATRRLNVSS